MSNIYIHGEFTIQTDLSTKSMNLSIYHGSSQKFYKRILSELDLIAYQLPFNFVELTKILQTCVDADPDYILNIEVGDKVLIMNFICKEKIKVYQFSITLFQSKNNTESLHKTIAVLKEDNIKTSKKIIAQEKQLLIQSELIENLSGKIKTITEMMFSYNTNFNYYRH
jgi:hypothetical protein